MKYSIGKIKAISEDNFNIYHFCTTEQGSSGGPIINLFNLKVIGIHKGSKEKKYNLGTLLKIVIDEFNEKYYNKIDKNNEEKINIKEEKKIDIISNKATQEKILINSNIKIKEISPDTHGKLNKVFNESFITPKILQKYKALLNNMEKDYFNFDLINNNLDAYYCFLVNKLLSFKFCKEKTEILIKMKNIYNKTEKEINFSSQKSILYQYLLINELLEKEITNKILEGSLTVKEFEILLYSLRFVFNIKENNNNFYYNLIKPKAYDFIKKYYIPGSFQKTNEFIESYNILKKELKLGANMGYYICKDCGYLYKVPPSTFPIATYKCINGHIIGGIGHICAKKDIRVFYAKEDYDELRAKYYIDSWFDSLEPIMSLQEFI